MKYQRPPKRKKEQRKSQKMALSKAHFKTLNAIKDLKISKTILLTSMMISMQISDLPDLIC
jgi:hypothetical protein